jgi:hypothetical protein
MVIHQKEPILKASKILDIKLSTAKYIVNQFKKLGKIMEKKK